VSLPDWDLAELRAFPPDFLRVAEGDDDDSKLAKKVTLMLALVFNDLKALNWVGVQLAGEEIPAGEEISPRAGQKFGMKITVERWANGIIFEFFELLDKNQRVLEGKVFKKALRKIPRKASEAWAELVAIALRKPGHDAKSRKMFASVRNLSAFHYWNNLDELYAGYLKHFDGPPAPQRQNAYVSLGENMEGTRFYFADAAAGGVMERTLARSAADIEQVNKMGRYVNEALRWLLQELLEYFERTREV